jgi:hypothetical protein
MSRASDSPVTFPRIASIYGAAIGPDATEVELQMAARYDLLIGGLHVPPDREGRSRLNGRLKRLRELNPGIVLLHFAASAPYWGAAEGEGIPEEAFLHTTDGKRIAGWPGTQMLNLARPEALDLLTHGIASHCEGLDVDGAFVDCMGAGFDAWAVQIETHEKVAIDADGDGKPDDKGQLDRVWVEGKRALLQRLRTALGGQTVLMVNAQAGAEYIRPFVNGNYYEDYIDYAIDCRMDWPTVLRLYQEECALPHAPNCTTINASSGVWPEYEAWSRLPAEECQDLLEYTYGQLRRMRFGLTTALMGDGYYGYDLNTRWRGQHWWYPEFDAPLGTAAGPGGPADDGTWRREFEGGLVVVNPQVKRARMTLARRYRDFTTGWSGREFSIPAQDGRIFLPVA